MKEYIKFLAPYDLRHKLNKSKMPNSDSDNSIKEIMMISLDNKNDKGAVHHKKRNITEINKISKVDFEARARP